MTPRTQEQINKAYSCAIMAENELRKFGGPKTFVTTTEAIYGSVCVVVSDMDGNELSRATNVEGYIAAMDAFDPLIQQATKALKDKRALTQERDIMRLRYDRKRGYK